ncbi:MAG: MBL fold metallo-hydrolase [Thermoguttaceae bacterium]|nr:MBL fold metallo-hydrolase [Thermoguttaceae bacterium]
MESIKVHVLPVVSVPFEENSYIVYLDGSSRCLVIDPGLEPDRIVQQMDAEKLTPAAILNTHGHADHIGGNAALKQRWPDCPLIIGEDDARKLTDPQQNLSAPFGFSVTSPPADATVTDGQVYSAAGIDLRVLVIPGHSVGHVVYLIEEHEPPLAFVGDVIFSGSIGRTDFPDGSFQSLADGIRSKLYRLPANTELFPGHGPPTTVGQEKTHNPFVAGL